MEDWPSSKKRIREIKLDSKPSEFYYYTSFYSTPSNYYSPLVYSEICFFDWVFPIWTMATRYSMVSQRICLIVCNEFRTQESVTLHPKALHWLPVRYRIKLKIAALTYRCVYIWSWPLLSCWTCYFIALHSLLLYLRTSLTFNKFCSDLKTRLLHLAFVANWLPAFDVVPEPLITFVERALYKSKTFEKRLIQGCRSFYADHFSSMV